MNGKLKHLPFNLVFRISSWAIPFLIISQLSDNMLVAVIVSTYIYLTEVVQATTNDYFEERIEKLEKNQNQI